MSIQEYQKRIKEKYCDENLEVVYYHSFKEKTIIQCKDCLREYVFSRAGDVLKKNKKCVCQNCGKQRRIQKKFEQSLKDRYNEPFVLVNFTDTQSPCTLLCPVCGSVFSVEHATSLRSRTHLCNKCHPFRNQELQETIKNFINFINESPQWELGQDLKNIHSQEKIKCKCLLCGKMNEKTMYDYLRGIKCQCSRENDVNSQILLQAKEEYQVIKTARVQEDRIQLVHKNCGYKYSVKAKTFLDGWGRCPKCNRKHSKGERLIKNWLDKKQIAYEMEYPKILEGHLLRFDFYLPKYNLYIEFQGEQHYKSVAFFDKRNTLSKRQKYDELKEKFCGSNLLQIPYYDIDKIDSILAQRVQRLS